MEVWLCPPKNLFNFELNILKRGSGYMIVSCICNLDMSLKFNVSSQSFSQLYGVGTQTWRKELGSQKLVTENKIPVTTSKSMIIFQLPNLSGQFFSGNLFGEHNSVLGSRHPILFRFPLMRDTLSLQLFSFQKERGMWPVAGSL